MATRAAPLWLARPSRVAGIEWRRARWALLALGALLLAVALLAGAEPPAGDPVHAALVASLRHGGGFYPTLRDLALSTPGGLPAPPMPALARVEALLPAPALPLLLAALLTATLWCGAGRIAQLLRAGLPRVAAMILLGYGLAAGTLLATAQPTLGWSALLVTLALLLRRPDRWLEAAAIGGAAALVDPAALLACALAAALALAGRRRGEAAGWALAALLAAAAAVSHHVALAAWPLPAADAVAPGAVPALLLGAALPLLPAPLAGIVALLALAGWLALRAGLATRWLLLLAAGLLADDVAGARPALLAAPLLPLGLAFVPDALRDLVRAALGRRRITVTRITR